MKGTIVFLFLLLSSFTEASLNSLPSLNARKHLDKPHIAPEQTRTPEQRGLASLPRREKEEAVNLKNSKDTRQHGEVKETGQLVPYGIK